MTAGPFRAVREVARKCPVGPRAPKPPMPRPFTGPMPRPGGGHARRGRSPAEGGIGQAAVRHGVRDAIVCARATGLPPSRTARPRAPSDPGRGEDLGGQCPQPERATRREGLGEGRDVAEDQVPEARKPQRSRQPSAPWWQETGTAAARTAPRVSGQARLPRSAAVASGVSRN